MSNLHNEALQACYALVHGDALVLDSHSFLQVAKHEHETPGVRFGVKILGDDEILIYGTPGDLSRVLDF